MDLGSNQNMFLSRFVQAVVNTVFQPHAGLTSVILVLLSHLSSCVCVNPAVAMGILEFKNVLFFPSHWSGFD